MFIKHKTLNIIILKYSVNAFTWKIEEPVNVIMDNLFVIVQNCSLNYNLEYI